MSTAAQKTQWNVFGYNIEHEAKTNLMMAIFHDLELFLLDQTNAKINFFQFEKTVVFR